MTLSEREEGGILDQLFGEGFLVMTFEHRSQLVKLHIWFPSQQLDLDTSVSKTEFVIFLLKSVPPRPSSFWSVLSLNFEVTQALKPSGQFGFFLFLPSLPFGRSAVPSLGRLRHPSLSRRGQSCGMCFQVATARWLNLPPNPSLCPDLSTPAHTAVTLTVHSFLITTFEVLVENILPTEWNNRVLPLGFKILQNLGSAQCSTLLSKSTLNSPPDTSLNTAGMNSFRPRDNALRLVLPVTAMLQLELSRPRDVPWLVESRGASTQPGF